MAKVLLYDKSTANSIFISGILDKEARSITYSENDEIKQVNTQSLLNEFANKKIELIIFIEYEKEYMVNIDDLKNANIFGTLDESESIIYGTLDESISKIQGIL